VITPASGFVTANGAVTIGLLAGVVPFLACTQLKKVFGYDDALDTFGVHGVGGTLGALVTGFLATPEANPNLNTNLSGIVGTSLWLEQIKAIGLTIGLAALGTTVLGTLVKVTIGLRPDAESEEDGLDQLDHGEAGYHPDEEGALAGAHGIHGGMGGSPALAGAVGALSNTHESTEKTT
jgi:Amt family ammonium transporter